MTVEIAPR